MAVNDLRTDDESTFEPLDQPEPLDGFTGFERDVLFAISRLTGTNPHGMVIKEELEDHYDEDINHGRLYQNLRGLIDEGLVDTLPLDGRTNVYRLTEEAEERLVAHREWETECLAENEAE